jgi:hypothetical protein
MLAEIKTIRSTLRSGQHDGTKVMSGGLGLTEDVRGETGRVEISGTIDKNTTAIIEFKKKYVDPVVVVYITTRGGGQSIEARVKDVKEDGCTIFLEEPDDENHNPETIIYIVMEKGSHITDAGYRIEAGIHTTDKHRRGGQTDFEGDFIKFSKMFKGTPAVLHSLNTYNNGAFATTMAQNVTAEGFEVAQELAETKKPAMEESIAWIAFERFVGKGFITDVKGEAGLVTATTNTGVDNKVGVNVEFNAGFVARPDVVVKGQTMNGTDGYWARGAGAWSKDLVKVYGEEDQRTDKERSHTKETFAYVALEADSLINTIRPNGYRTSDTFKLDNISIRQPLITTWDVNNFNNFGVQVRVSKDYGITWTDWMICEYAKALPGIPTTGDLDGIVLTFRYNFYNDVEVPVKLTEMRLETDGKPVLVEGNNVGGLATDGSDWNSSRIF